SCLLERNGEDLLQLMVCCADGQIFLYGLTGDNLESAGIELSAYAGDPAIHAFRDGRLGIAYRSTDENRLNYGEWQNGEFSLLYEADNEQSGHASRIIHDLEGNPSIYSIGRGGVMYTGINQGGFVQFSLGLAGSRFRESMPVSVVQAAKIGRAHV